MQFGIILLAFWAVGIGGVKALMLAAFCLVGPCLTVMGKSKRDK
jgi:hypothetical protein